MLKRIIATVFICCSFIGTSLNAETVLINYIPLVESRMEAKAVQAFAKNAEELSDGSLKINNYHVGSLGFKNTDLLRHLKRNTVHMGSIIGPYYQRDAPELAMMFADGVALKPNEMRAFTPIFEDIATKSLEKWQIKLVGMYHIPIFDHSMFCRKPVTSLDQLKKVKLRVWNKHQLLAFKALDVPAQIVPIADLYVALQTGVVDCALYFGEAAHTVALQEVAKYETYLLPVVMPPASIGVSNRTWKKLDTKSKVAILKAGSEISKKSLNDAIAFGNHKGKFREARKKAGFVLTEGFPKSDTDSMVKQMRQTWKEMCTETGSGVLKNHNRIMANVTH